MKVSLNWLSTWVPINLDVPSLCDLLTMAGLEVDGHEPAAASLENVVVGRVEACEQHPDADKLSVCQVSDGTGENFTVVCGAPNVAKDQTVAYARPGAVLPNGMKLKVAKLRGVESHGMLCSAAELGLGDAADGIITLPDAAPIGATLVDYLSLDDHIIDIDLTPNRGDCLSIVGVARELAALTQQSAPSVSVDEVPADHETVFPVEIEAPDACARYAGRIITGVKANAATPIWLSEALRRAGVRSISPIVDITNYVMLELGQPMHAFDLAKLSGGIKVRRARTGESLVLLDGQTVELADDSLVIADHHGPVALAGIMGGELSGVQAHTTDVLLESAFFDPIQLAGVARQFRLHTDASHRFERGVDFTGQQRAIQRATALILEICGGKAGPIEVAESASHLPTREPIEFAPTLVKDVLGVEIADETIEAMLSILGCEVRRSEANWQVIPPTYRFDLSIPVDLVEEVARLYGYDNLATTMPNAVMAIVGENNWRQANAEIRTLLIDKGYFESITYSFINEESFANFSPELASLTLENPISSDMAVMRASLLPGLVNALQYNQNRQHADVRLFEIGRVFRRGESGLKQPINIAAIASGRREPEHWDNDDGKLDFYDIKQIIEDVISVIGLTDAEAQSCTNPAFHPGQSVAYFQAGLCVAEAGVLHPKLVQQFGLRHAPMLFEMTVPEGIKQRLPGFVPLSKFPAVRRDLSVVVADTATSEDVLNACTNAAGELLRDLQLFDVFRGQGIDSDKKSVALGLIFQASSRTLTEDEIEASVQRVLKRLSKDFDATLRE
jgi:phenylalanyl-tRNA synthetase beta chain